MVQQSDYAPQWNIPPDVFSSVPPSGKAVGIGTALQGIMGGQQAAAELQRRRQMQQQMQAISQAYPQLAPFLTQDTFPKIAEQAASKAFEPGMPVYVNHQTQKISLQPQEGYQLYGNLPREHALKMWEVQQQKDAMMQDREKQNQQMNLFRQQGADQRAQALAQQKMFNDLLQNYRSDTEDLRAQLGRAQHPLLNAWSELTQNKPLFSKFTSGGGPRKTPSPSSGLTPEEQAEFARLDAKYGGSQ